MRSISLSFRTIIVACCVASVASGDEAIVRISDADSQPGVVRIQDEAETSEQDPAVDATAQPVKQNFTAIYSFDQQPAGIQPISYAMPAGVIVPVGYSHACGANGCSPGCAVPEMMYCDPNCCPQGGCDLSCPQMVCDGSFGCDPCQSGYVNNSCDSCYYGPAHKQRVLTLFAKSAPANCCETKGPCKRWVRGQQMNYLARNQRLSNHLFGWLVPSGCGGVGSAPVGAYQITYADQPTYSHPQDGMAWGAQGYGVPVQVPVPPTVRASYNYSWGLPASRLTPTGNPVPGTVPQPLVKQTW